MSCVPWLSRGVRWRRRDGNNVTTIAQGGGGGERLRRDLFTPFSDSPHRECEEEKVGSYRKASSTQHNKLPFRYLSSNNCVSLHRGASTNNLVSPSTEAGCSIHNDTRYRKADNGNQNSGSSLLLLRNQGDYACNSNSNRRNSCGHTTIEEGEGRVSPYDRRCTPPTLRLQFSASSEEEPQHAAEGNASTCRSRRSRNNTESSAISSSSSNSSSSGGSAAVVNADNNNTRTRRLSSSRGRRGGRTATTGKNNKDTNTDSKRGGHTEKTSSSKVTAPAASSHSSSSSQKDAPVSRVRLTVTRNLRVSTRDEIFPSRSETKNTLQQMKTGGEEEEEEVEEQRKEAPSRRTSVSRSSGPIRGRRRGSALCEEGSYATSEETAAYAGTVGASLSKNASRARGEEATASVYCGGAGDVIRAQGRGRGGGGGGEAVGENVSANESEKSEEGRKSRMTAGAGNSRYFPRHSTVMAGRRRTGRLSERWSSAFLRSRRSAFLAEDSIPVMLPMSQTDRIIVDRLSRKINSSNFATVLKAYLIIKTRIAAQRANKEYSQSQRKGKPGAALRLLLNRQNNRVALRVRPAGDARGGEDATTAAPSLSTQAEAAANATAASTVKAAAVITRNSNESSSVNNTRPNSQVGDGASYTSGRNMGATSRPGGNTGEGSEEDKAGQQEELATAVRGAASAGGGSIIGCGILGEKSDVSLASASVAAPGASAAGASGNSQRRDPQNRLKAVGVVGRMQAHQSLLEQRLAFLGLRSVYINGDGNCLFRSCSYNLYGTEEHHRYVRLHATQHMRSAAHQKDYSIFFEDESEFDTYLKNMQRLGTWGDELCVRAIADSFECTVHIITSTDSNWYLRYDPQTEQPSITEEDKEQENEGKGGREGLVGGSAKDNISAVTKSGTALKHIFLTYISPVHYNAFTIAEDATPASQSE